MTSPQDPGNPDNTDPEATTANSAEAAAEEAQAAQELDPTLEEDLEEALSGIDAEAVTDADADATDAAPEAGDEAAAADADSLEAQLAERTEDLQRLNAEYTNYRRRTERERAAAAEMTKAKVLAEFLPILDDLELARQHGDLESGPLKAIADKLSGVLSKHKLEAFGEEGDAFDPEIHEAVQDLSSGGEQVLGTVLRRGYKVGERVVRTAMVIISDPSEDSGSDAEDSSEE
ncbi:nucleotide exchange factor GrpE [Corynebacterium sp.]|uniref:nucleotide exchange factor GrpE n=1 Tax=Corynebacterium sp. TaxID=1720 RepID=UPI0026DCC27E|nr:nucleotide exchange factor GrpE [Corynebacterium sp.]MDO5032757.1 nucleotide exchange factor GrpE [Corynebacterium sp.]